MGGVHIWNSPGDDSEDEGSDDEEEEEASPPAHKKPGEFFFCNVLHKRSCAPACVSCACTD